MFPFHQTFIYILHFVFLKVNSFLKKIFELGGKMKSIPNVILGLFIVLAFACFGYLVYCDVEIVKNCGYINEQIEEVQTTEEQIDSVVSNLYETNEYIDELESELDELKKDNQSKSSRVDYLESELDRAKTLAESYEQQLEELKSQIEST